MKKKAFSLIACLLALLMLVGCGASETEERDTIPFDEMVYARPEMGEMDVLMEELQTLLDTGASYRRVEGKLDECFDWYYSFYTMYTLAEVHSYLDMTDEYYADEFEWISENYALVQQAYDQLYYACAGSKLADRLEKNYFWEGFVEEYSDPEDSVYSDEYVALMQQESDLLARYRETVAAPVISFDGEEADFYTLLAELDGPDYVRAVKLYYETYNEPLAQLYLELMHVRKAMAAQQDYDSYEQMQYEFYFDRDFKPEEAAYFLDQIKETMVPFYEKLARTGAWGGVWYDEVDEDMLFGILEKASGEVGGDVAEAFAFMSDYGLYDISVSTKKAQMSFETYFPDYDAPFVFLGAAGDTEDVLGFAHEFGHFCDAYVNAGALDESVDLAEVYSQAMELLILSRLSDALSEEDVDNIARMKVLDLADMYVQQAAFAEFETRVYAMDEDELNAEKLNETMLELSKDYGFFAEGYEWVYAMCWMDITHLFEMPFYVISYPVSNDLAMQIYALESAEAGSGMEKYLSVLEHDYTGIMELVEDGDFASPFSEGRMEDTVRLMRELCGMA